MRRISGIQPSGLVHLGNYFGAIKQHIAQQDNAFYFVANWHSLTGNVDRLRERSREAFATYLALGLDTSKATLFLQSSVPEVHELAWYLASVTPKALLDRGHAYKAKTEQGIKATLGLYTYPALMAADIIAYDANLVPVGSDQIQHVEMTRDMVTAYHARYGEGVFETPQAEIILPSPVPGTDGLKMSKSYGNTIPLFATGKPLKELVMRIKTDSQGINEPKDLSTCIPYQIYKLFASSQESEAMAAKLRGGGYGYGHAKVDLYKALEEHFADARQRYENLCAHPDDMEDLIRIGGQRARGIAQATLERARSKCGIG